MNDILLYISLGLAILWSIRMAQSKRRNPFVWAGLTFSLMLIPTLLFPSLPPILGITPLLILVFLKPSKPVSEPSVPSQIICPKCTASHMSGYNYCVNCGWELTKPYSSTTVSIDPTESTSEPLDNPVELPVYESQQDAINEELGAPSDPDKHESLEGGIEMIPTDNSTEGENQSEENARPIPIRPTTAAGFTDLGIKLSVEGRHREAIDQFTKSIALDAQYALAWEKRAASYQVLGLNEKSSQDLEHLKGLPSN